MKNRGINRGETRRDRKRHGRIDGREKKKCKETRGERVYERERERHGITKLRVYQRSKTHLIDVCHNKRVLKINKISAKMKTQHRERERDKNKKDIYKIVICISKRSKTSYRSVSRINKSRTKRKLIPINRKMNNRMRNTSIIKYINLSEEYNKECKN